MNYGQNLAMFCMVFVAFCAVPFIVEPTAATGLCLAAAMVEAGDSA